MSGNQSQKARKDRRAEARRERKHGQQYPELVQSQNELDGKLEREMNRVRFGPLEPRNEAQARCISEIERNRLSFVTGPAGTGKTFIAASIALSLIHI